MNKFLKYAFAFSFILQSQLLVAQTNWIQATNNDWNTSTNWSAGVPDSTDATTVTNNGGFAQLSTGPVGAAASLDVGSPAGTTVEILGIPLTVGGDVLIGPVLGSIGTFNIVNAPVIATSVTVGNGLGFLNATQAASLSANQINVGNTTVGIATFSDPGTTITTQTLNAGISVGSSGTINLLNGAVVSAGGTVIGSLGQGALNVSNDGTILNTTNLFVGVFANGIVNIDNAAKVLVDNDVNMAIFTGNATINLSGAAGARGLLSARDVTKGAALGTINFDGGILRANANNPTFITGFDPLDLNVLPGGAFIDSQGFDIATANSFSGSGQIIKQGSGRLTLSGMNLVGGATVEEGTLAVDGLLTNLVVVNPGATLTGAGAVGALTNLGTVAPGNGIGTLTVLTDHINTSTGIHQNELNAAGQTDLLAVAGTSTLQGGTLDIVAAPGNYLTGTTYTLITAAGGLSGQFATVIDNLPINYFLRYLPNSLVLELGDPVPLNGLACNSRRVAEYINTFISFGGDNLAVLDALQSLGFDDLYNALDQLQPASFQALSITSGDAAHAVNDSFMDRLNFLRITRCGQCCDPCDQGGVWISGLANYVSFDRVGCVRGFDATNGGFAIGYDKCFCDDIIAGVGAGYSNNYIKWNRHFGHSDGQNAYLGVYATQFNEDYYADVSLLGFKGTYKSKRHIEFADIDRRAKSKQCNWGINPHFGSGLILDYCGFDVIPFGEIDYYYLSQDKFREHGANSLNLHVKSNDASALRLETGVRFAKAYDCGCGQFLPYASISYVGHRYYGRKFKSSFNDQSNDFSVFGVDRCFNQAEFGLGLAYLINDQFAINASYDIDVGSKRQQQEFNFELNYRF